MMFPSIARELVFTQGEYDRRLAAVQKEMARREVDTLIVTSPENIFYVTGYQTFGFHSYQQCVIPSSGKPFLILRYMESMLAARDAWTDDVVAYDDTESPSAVTLRELEARSLSKGTVGLEERAHFLLVSVWKALTAALPKTVDGSGIVETSRAVKSPEELANMRKAAELTDLGTQAALNEIAAGRTDNDVAAAAFDAMTRAGAEYLQRDPIVCAGPNAGLPHSCYRRYVMKEGDTVLLEMSGVYNRHYAPVMRGAVIGKPSSDVSRMADVIIETLQTAIEAVRPGVTAAEVDHAARRVIEREGLWDRYRKRAGYSVGIGLSTWVEGGIASLKEDDETVLKPGMCFHLPMALRDYGRSGLGFSETIVVTDSGCERLGNLPCELRVN